MNIPPKIPVRKFLSCKGLQLEAMHSKIIAGARASLFAKLRVDDGRREAALTTDHPKGEIPDGENPRREPIIADPTIDKGRIDPEVVAALYRESADELRNFLVGVLRSADLANEALQAAFEKAIERGHTARRETLKGWLFRVAYNEALVIKRKQEVHERSLPKLAWSCPPQDSPAQAVLRSDEVEKIKRLLHQLPSDQRVIVEKKIYEEQTFAAIAAELKLPLGTVLTRMRSAIISLRKQLGSDE